MTLLPSPVARSRVARDAIPHVDTAELAPAGRRFRRVLVGLCVLALLCAAILALLPSRGAKTPGALAGGDGLMVVIDVSSSTLGFSDTIGKSLLVLAREPEQKAGLVLASESAYMALPPDTPGSALRGWQRMIAYVNQQNQKLAARAKLDRTPLPNPAPGDYPWVGIFTGGTKLSAGLAKAIQGLRESGRKGGQIVLISDLRDPPEDLPKVSALIAKMKSLGIQLRIVTVGDASRDPAFFSDYGGAKFITGAADAVLETDRLQVRSPNPSAWPLIAAGVGLALLLALLEVRLPAALRQEQQLMQRRWLRALWGVALLGVALLCAVAFRGVALAERSYTEQSAAWQRGAAPRSVSEPGLDLQLGETLLGLHARAEAQRAYERYRQGLADVIPGTRYPQTQARFDLVARLTELRSSLGERDQAALDVVLGAVLTDSAKTAGEQRRTQLQRALDSFRRALSADPDNDSAKLGLEVLLQRDVQQKQKASAKPSSTAGRKPLKQQDPKGPVAPTQAEGQGF